MTVQTTSTVTMSVYTSLTSTDSHESITLDDFVKRLRLDKETATLVRHLRTIYKADGKDAYKAARKRSVLKLITPSGVFTKRKSDGLAVHSGLYVYDLDDLSEGALAKVWAVATERCDGALALMFVSPSGDGLKLILRGPVADDEDDHITHWDAGKLLIERVHKSIDQGQDVCRLCYWSHDPDPYYNPDAVPFGSVVGPVVDRQTAVDKALAELDSDAGEEEALQRLLDNAANRVQDLTLNVAREALRHINPFVAHNEWFPTIMALKAQWGVDDPDEDQALALAHEWSRGALWEGEGDNNYDEKRLNGLWRTAQRVSGKVHTMRSVLRAAAVAGYKPQAAAGDKDWKSRLQRDPNGKLLDTHDNLLLILTRAKEFEGRFRFDSFHNTEHYREGEHWVQVDDHLLRTLAGRLETIYCRPVDYTKCCRAIDSAIHNCVVNSLQSYLQGVVWDGKPRMDKLFLKGFVAEDKPAYRLFARKFMISAVARAMQPGCKVDTMPVLTGSQGRAKSTGWRALAGDDYFGEGHLDLQGNAKDAMEVVGKLWIYEMSELTTMRRGDRDRVKGFISNQVDTFRVAYGRKATKVPRKVVFVGTGNDSKFLNDPTGGRRYWPVQLADRGSKLDNALASQAGAAWIRKLRDQLWAEAVAAYKGGEQWWLTAQEDIDLAAPLQEAAREKPEWEDGVCIVMDNPKKWESNQKGTKYMLKTALYTYLEEAGIVVNHFMKTDIGRFINGRYYGQVEEAIMTIKESDFRVYRRVD